MVPFRTRRVSTRFLIMTWKRPSILRLRENGEGWLTIKPRCLKPPLRKQVRRGPPMSFRYIIPCWKRKNMNRHGNSGRSEEHTSELQSLMRISYAVFCLKKYTKNKTHETDI